MTHVFTATAKKLWSDFEMVGVLALELLRSDSLVDKAYAASRLQTCTRRRV